MPHTPPQRPPLKREAFHVWVAPEGTTDTDTLDESEMDYHYVVVQHRDQLKAETLAGANGIPDLRSAPLHLTSLMVWCALTRAEKFTGNFPLFKTRCIQYEPDKARDTDTLDEADAHPTEASTDSD